MSNNKREFEDMMNKRVQDLVKNAKIHPETSHISFAAPTVLSEGITEETMKANTREANDISLAQEKAMAEIAIAQYPETKKVNWTSSLNFGGHDIQSELSLQSKVGDVEQFGTLDTVIRHPYNEQQLDWYSVTHDSIKSQAQGLFDDKKS